jgi:ubiquinone/menaquinone biosynthesis C-methylase UbiE
MREEILRYYSSGVEADRLERYSAQLEKIRTQEILLRYLDKKKMKVLDVGGGAGVYAFWLKQAGHEVHLLDPSPVNLAHARSKETEMHCTLDAVVKGIAAELPYADESFDVVLVLGPLYHLTERKDRLDALKEARRVLKKNGFVFIAAISRYASLFDGFTRNLVADPEFLPILRQDLQNGQHRNNTNNFEYFTTAFFHHPDELKAEISEAGFIAEAILPVESFGWIVPGFEEKWTEESYRQLLLDTIRAVEHDETMLGISAHLIGVGSKGN